MKWPPAPEIALPLSERSRVDARPSPLASAIENARAQAPDLIDLTLSNPTRAGLSYAAYESASACLSDASAAYEPDPLGLALARAAVCSDLGLGARDAPSPDRVLMTASTSEAYERLFTLLCDPGDDVLAPEPSYPLFAHLARYADVRLSPYRLAYDGAWHLDFDSLARARTPRTRAVLLVSPNNPTGSCPSPKELSRLGELGLPLVCDEVFARYPFDPAVERLPSALGQSDALTFCLDGLSKSAGLPQLKLGWIVAGGPEPLVDEVMHRLGFSADAYLSVASPVQRALPQLLSAAAEFRRPLLSRLRHNRAHLARALASTPASLLAAAGGWTACVRVPAVVGDEAWVLGLLERQRVLVHPGHFYDFDANAAHLVLSLLTPSEQFERGVARLVNEVARRCTG